MKASRKRENEVFRSCKKISHTGYERRNDGRFVGEGSMEGGVQKQRPRLVNCFIAYHMLWS